LKRIFIIEDEIVVAKSIAKMLSNYGYKIAEITTSYKEAKEKILTAKPHLILCDINLNSEKTGIELMKELNPKYNIPFIFISAYSDVQTLQKANTAAPCNYITKPFNEKQLLVSIERVFGNIENIRNIKPTDRELSILKLIGKGYSSKEIASELSISFNTVETHRKNLIKKYNVNSMNELICMAASEKWIKYEK
jgi:DNA-binding NarL/FixJ family response regulator